MCAIACLYLYVSDALRFVLLFFRSSDWLPSRTIHYATDQRQNCYDEHRHHQYGGDKRHPSVVVDVVGQARLAR